MLIINWDCCFASTLEVINSSLLNNFKNIKRIYWEVIMKKLNTYFLNHYELKWHKTYITKDYHLQKLKF